MRATLSQNMLPNLMRDHIATVPWTGDAIFNVHVCRLPPVMRDTLPGQSERREVCLCHPIPSVKADIDREARCITDSIESAFENAAEKVGLGAIVPPESEGVGVVGWGAELGSLLCADVGVQI